MNLILLRPEEIRSQEASFNDHRAEHLRAVLKSAPDDTVRVGIIGGLLGSATILQLDREGARLHLECRTPPPPPAAVDLILALPRPLILKRVLAQATALGVKRIMLINANRVEKSFFRSSQLAPAQITAQLELGLEQAMDTILPEVSIHPRFRPFVEDELPRLLPAYQSGLVAHPEAPQTLGQMALTPGRRLLAVGPEGGWVDFEIERFQAQGFLPFSLGPRILRVDTAVSALLAQLELLAGLTPPGG